jgi:hypothetical protein
MTAYRYPDRFVIGIDPGRHLGYAFVGSGMWWDTYDLGPAGPEQLVALAKEVREMVDPTGRIPGDMLVCYEEPAMLRGHALVQIQRQLGVIIATLEEAGVPHYPVNQSTLKAWVRLNYSEGGKMDKEAMRAAAREVGALIEDHNAADAYWLARYGQEVVWNHVFAANSTGD